MHHRPRSPSDLATRRHYRDAQDLIDHGLPVFTAPVSRRQGREFDLPRGWQHTRPTPLDDPQDALIMVTGQTLAVIDLDPQNNADVELETAAALALGVIVVAMVDTPGGGRHLYVPATGHGCTANTRTGVDYRGIGGCVYLPGTHRPKYAGNGYAWQQRIDWSQLDLTDGSLDDHRRAVDAYLERTGSTARPPHTTPEVPAGEHLPFQALPRAARTALAGNYHGDRTRSGKFHRAVWAAAAAGWTAPRITAALTPWCIRHHLYTGRGAAEGTPSPSKRRTPPRTPTPPTDITRVHYAVRQHRWAGKAGQTDRQVLAHLITRAQSLGRSTFTEARSTIAAALGVRPATVTASLDRLITAGWITRTRTATARKAAEYTLEVPGAAGFTPPVTEGYGLGTPLTGSPRERILRAAETGATLEQITRDVGLATRTVRRHLAELERDGLITATRTPGNSSVWTTQSTEDPQQQQRRAVITARVVELRSAWHRGHHQNAPPPRERIAA